LNVTALKRTLANEIWRTDNLPVVPAISFLLRLKGSSIQKVATECKVDRQVMYAVLNGKQKSVKVRKCVTDILNFDLFE
jgi:hypothetical protein